MPSPPPPHFLIFGWSLISAPTNISDTGWEHSIATLCGSKCSLITTLTYWRGLCFHHKKQMSLDSAGDQAGNLQDEQVAWQPLFQCIPSTEHLQGWNGNLKPLFFSPSLQISPWLLLNTFLTIATIIFYAFHNNWENHCHSFSLWELHKWEILISSHIVLLGITAWHVSAFISHHHCILHF